MKSSKDFFAGFKHGPQDVVGIDLDESETRVVRLRKGSPQPTVVGAEILPTVASASPSSESESANVQPLSIPAKLRSKYAALAMPGNDAIVKLLSFPGQFDADAEQKVVQNLGLSDPDKYRISYKLLSEGHGRGESRVLAVALSEPEARKPPRLLPSGTPAPFSIEVSGLAVMTAFLNGPAAAGKDGALGILDLGSNTSTFAIFNKRQLALVRRFSVGSNSIVVKVQESLGVDHETAVGIMTDGAFDISQSIEEVMEPLVKQLIVSRDFVERRENCRVGGLYLMGNFGASKDLHSEMKSALGIEIGEWNPFDGLSFTPEVIPEAAQGKEWRFAAAIGACLAVLEEA